MSEAMLELMPNAATHHIGMYRLKGCPIPVQYYNRLPKGNVADVTFVLDPIIASGITLAATVGQLKLWGCPKIVVVSLIATTQGAAALLKEHPDVELFVAQASDDLTEDGKAVPGLGDAGDRQFDTSGGEDESERKRSVDESSSASPSKAGGKKTKK
jgi:uracil phosphoribosyltransferase